MKRIGIVSVAFMAFAFAACEKEYTDFTRSDNSDLIEVGINLVGDVDITTSPLTKGTSSPNIYYAFEVDSIHIEPENGSVHTGITYCHYAEGVFTSINNLTIILRSGTSYRFRCSIVEDGEEALFVKEDYLQEPFASSVYNYGSQTKVTNSFVYGENKTLYAYNTMNVVRVADGTVGGTSKWNALVNRYYGEVITDGSRGVNIDMERRNFGLHFSLIPPSEGSLKVYMDYGFPKFEYVLTNDSGPIEEEHIYSLDLENDFANIYLKVEWTDLEGKVTDLSPEKFKVYNKTIANIKVDVNDRIKGENVNTNIGLNTDDTMTRNENYTIN